MRSPYLIPVHDGKGIDPTSEIVHPAPAPAAPASGGVMSDISKHINVGWIRGYDLTKRWREVFLIDLVFGGALPAGCPNKKATI